MFDWLKSEMGIFKVGDVVELCNCRMHTQYNGVHVTITQPYKKRKIGGKLIYAYKTDLVLHTNENGHLYYACPMKHQVRKIDSPDPDQVTEWDKKSVWKPAKILEEVC